MADKFDAVTQSRVMKQNKGRGNKSTELRLRAFLVASGVRGWKIQPKNIFGKPDFVFEKARVAIFVDGCFWHGCRLCKNVPESRRKFWGRKLTTNKRRDKFVSKHLKSEGWLVMRFWEHDVAKEPLKCILEIERVVA